MHIECSSKRFMTVSSTSSNECRSFKMLPDTPSSGAKWNQLRMHFSSDKSKDRRTEIVVRILCVLPVHMVRCVGCVCDFEMTVNFRRVTTHIFSGLTSQCPTRLYLSFHFFFFFFVLPFMMMKKTT